MNFLFIFFGRDKKLLFFLNKCSIFATTFGFHIKNQAMNRFVLLSLLLLPLFSLFAQVDDSAFEHLDSLYFFTPTILTEYDEAQLQNLPKMRLSPERRSMVLPSAVNNADGPYFPPIFYQAALECGQAASISFLFSYETAIRRGYTDLSYSYSHHYTGYFNWNFCNGGKSAGVSVMDSWQNVRDVGAMFVPDWGATYHDGGASKWVSGYEKYYNAMRNRIVEMVAIPTDTEEGILTLKHWLYDHACGDARGGMANFYTVHKQPDAQLPEGTPEAGFSFMTQLSTSVNHCLTIVGYNDSIRYDFNGDGQYTNDVDINNDGVVNVKDWEIGGVLFCNTFGANYGTGGFCYLPYRLLASYPSELGIWNKCVYAVKIRDEVFPQLTAKVTLRHNSRNALRITAGVAATANATAPEHQLDIYAFDYQGGSLPMQGDTTNSAAEVLEFGLDLSPLLNYVTPNQESTYFLIVEEDDADGAYSGQVLEFSLLDYTGGVPVETACNSSPMNIANNTTTRLAINKSLNFSKPEVTTEAIEVNALEDFERHLYATGGKAGYRWTLSPEYAIAEITDSVTAPDGGNTLVPLNDNASGYATIELPFEFPCFDGVYNQIVVNADGFITFHYHTYNWPFMKSSKWQQRTTRMIAPFRANLVVSEIHKKVEADRVTVSYVARISGQSANSVQFTVVLYESGVIEFYYGNLSYSGSNFYAVLSRGDGIYFEELPISGAPASSVANRAFRLTPPHSVPGIMLNANGVLSGNVPHPVSQAPVDLICYDNNDVKCKKTILLTAYYPNPLMITDMEAVPDNVVRSGDTISVSLTVRNVDTIPFSNCQLLVKSRDSYVTMLDSVEYFGYIAGGNEYRLNNSISFIVDEQAPNDYPLLFETIITNDENFVVEGEKVFVVSGYDLSVNGYEVIGDNHRFDPNEWNTLQFEVQNVGVLPINNLSCQLRFDNSEIFITQAAPAISEFPTGEFATLEYEIYIGTNYQPQPLVDLYLDFYSGDDFLFTRVVTLYANWECFDFLNTVPVELQPTDWIVDAQEGALCSNTISHSDSTGFSFTEQFATSGVLTFTYKVSSENNYDWLSFYVDSVRVFRWSGEQGWSSVNYEFSAGEHTFEWRYEKDYSVHGGEDKAWVKAICYRLQPATTPMLTIDADEIYEILPRDTVAVVPLELQSANDAFLLFNAEILDENLNFVNWAFLDFSNGSINPYQSKNIDITLSSFNKENDEVCQANLYLKAMNGNEMTVPITMEVVSPVSIAEVRAHTFTCYPNPTENLLTIELPNTCSASAYCVLYDMYGRKMLSQPLSGQKSQLNLQSLPSGVYLLEVEGFPSVKVVKR